MPRSYSATEGIGAAYSSPLLVQATFLYHPGRTTYPRVTTQDHLPRGHSAIYPGVTTQDHLPRGHTDSSGLDLATSITKKNVPQSLLMR